MANFYAFYPPGSGGGGSNASVGVTGTTAPTSATEVGGVNAGNLVPVAVTAGGVVLVDGTSGTFPVSGTVTANQGTPGVGAWPVVAVQSGNWDIRNVTGAVSLPTGASTSALQTSGNTQLVTIASNQTNGTQVTAINNFPATQPVSGTVAATQSGTWNITNVSGTVSLPTGASTAAKQPALGTAGVASSDVITVQGVASMTALKVDGTGGTFPITAQTATATLTNVASSATSVTILALNTARKQATIFNDSTQILFLKLGTTASSSSYTVQLAANAYYELPGITCYTGRIDGIWASANGNARVTEIS